MNAQVRNNINNKNENFQFGQQQTLQEEPQFHQKPETSQYQKPLSFPHAQFPKQSNSNNLPPFNSCQRVSDSTPTNQTGGRGGGYPYPWNRGGRGRATSSVGAEERRMNSKTYNDENIRGYGQRGNRSNTAFGRNVDDNLNDRGYDNNLKNNPCSI